MWRWFDGNLIEICRFALVVKLQNTHWISSTPCYSLYIWTDIAIIFCDAFMQIVYYNDHRYSVCCPTTFFIQIDTFMISTSYSLLLRKRNSDACVIILLYAFIFFVKLMKFTVNWHRRSFNYYSLHWNCENLK